MSIACIVVYFFQLSHLASLGSIGSIENLRNRCSGDIWRTYYILEVFAVSLVSYVCWLQYRLGHGVVWSSYVVMFCTIIVVEDLIGYWKTARKYSTTNLGKCCGYVMILLILLETITQIYFAYTFVSTPTINKTHYFIQHYGGWIPYSKLPRNFNCTDLAGYSKTSKVDQDQGVFDQFCNVTRARGYFNVLDDDFYTQYDDYPISNITNSTACCSWSPAE